MTDPVQRHVLFLATNGFETSELFDPRQALIDAGMRVSLASLTTDAIRAAAPDDGGEARTIVPDLLVIEADPDDFDALVLPGGLANPDALRVNEDAVMLVQDFIDDGKLVAAICHAPWLLAEADVLDGRRLTCWPSLATDLRNAGAEVVDEEVVVDDNLITSRNPADIPAFNRALLAKLGELGDDA